MPKVEELMLLLNIDRQEAKQLIKDDNAKEPLPSVAEMERKAKEYRRYERGLQPRASPNRERKVDTDKLALNGAVTLALESLGVANIRIKTETEISFTFNGAEFTYKLTRHRAEKASHG